MKAATVSFVVSLIGVSYQMLSYGLAYLVDSRYGYYSTFYGINIYTSIFGILVGFWAISHLLSSRDSERAIWPAIILALGATMLGNLIIFWATPVTGGPLGTGQTVPADTVLTLLPSPLLLIAGGLIGLKAARSPRP